MADSINDDSSSSSSGSDEDFLTLNEGGSNLDREALVRKKLLENFYGKSAVAETTSPGSSGADDDDDDDFLGVPSGSHGDSSPQRGGGSNDLDSQDFDADGHRRRHVYGSSVHTLLATEDKLALQVRTLDSTMQTLVYENYSRFIDATDAIRSIGVNVQANEDGLKRLTQGMQSIDENSKAIEDELGTLRDQVAEKIRVKRLLTRLDTLLKLPQTLKTQISTGKYRTATTTYLSASSILSKHSEGFESLKSIELECKVILESMKEDLKNRLLHWSGRATVTYDDEMADGSKIPDPPKDISGIFECAGTLFLLLEDNGDSDNFGNTAEDLQSLSLSASIRLLDRILDTHMIEVQDRRYSAANPSFDANAAGEIPQLSNDQGNSFLIPKGFLNAILEVTTLYGMTFGRDFNGSLFEFVSESFSSFIIHVRSILLEESYQKSKEEEDVEKECDTVEVQDGANSDEAEISSTLSLLVQSVRELAKSLTVADAGIGPDYASGLVDQAVRLSESMVRRRVDQKFLRLRQSVLKKCLSPFVLRAVQERDACLESGKPAIRPLTQCASVMLSDCLQLVDDTIRSIVMSNASPDLSTVKDAVQSSVQKFASWLASVFEIMAGGESSDPSHVIEAPVWDVQADEEKDNMEGLKLNPKSQYVGEDTGDMSREDEAVVGLVHKAYKDFLVASGDEVNTVASDFILAMAELCRLAEGSVSAQLDQSIAAHLGGSKKKSKGIFPSSEAYLGVASPSELDDVSKRFRAAASRLVVLFATNRGFEVANTMCKDLFTVLIQDKLDEPHAPRDTTWQALELVKQTALECVGVFGGKARAGPVSTLEDSDNMHALSSTVSRKTGLQLDVERMFKEKVSIFPHPSFLMECSRNGVIFVQLNVALRSLVELVRISPVSPAGFHQLLIETFFLKLMIAHYVDADFIFQGSNGIGALTTLLDDLMSDAGTRCVDPGMGESDAVKFDSRSAVRGFMSDMALASVASKFVISEEDESTASAQPSEGDVTRKSSF